MRLMLLRHAKAEKAEPGMRDHERALNDRGPQRSPRVGGYLATHALVPDGVLVSTCPAHARNLGTAGEACRDEPAGRFEDRLYQRAQRRLLPVLKETEPARAHPAGDRPQSGYA